MAGVEYYYLRSTWRIKTNCTKIAPWCPVSLISLNNSYALEPLLCYKQDHLVLNIHERTCIVQKLTRFTCIIISNYLTTT